MNVSIDPDREYTKKELQELTGLAPNTIYDTIKACGLSSSQRTYSGAELLERFLPARSMVAGGSTYDEVRQAFRLKTAATAPETEMNAAGYATASEGISFANEVSQQVAESVRSIVVAGVKDLIPHIPKMAAMALEEMARSGAIRDAFAETRNAYLSGRSPMNYPKTPPLIVSVKEVPQESSSEQEEEPKTSGNDNETATDAWD